MKAKPLPTFLLTGLITIACSLTIHAQASSGAWDRVPLTSLRVGVAEADITPPVGISLAGYAERTGPSTAVHDPLRAVAIVFDDGKKRAAILSFDTMQLLKRDGDAMLAAVNQATGIPVDHIILNASHTHGAPLLRTDEKYNQEVLAKVVGITKAAIGKLRPASLGYGEGQIDFSINRRTLNSQGKAEGKLNPEGIVDRRVKILRIDSSDSVEPLALIMHAACHPNVFRGENTQISADFAGLAKSYVERNFDYRTTAMFLQGCGGDIRTNLPPVGGGWRNGSEADLTWVSYSLGSEAVRVATRLRVRETMLDRKREFPIAAAQDVLQLQPDPKKAGDPRRTQRDRIENGKIVFPIRALAVGDHLFVALPGEPVVEYALGIEKDLASLGMKVLVLGYTAADAGYVPVEHMIDEEGYEAAGPYWYGTEKAIREGVKKMVYRMLEK